MFFLYECSCIAQGQATVLFIILKCGQPLQRPFASQWVSVCSEEPGQVVLTSKNSLGLVRSEVASLQPPFAI